jgi:N-acetylglucosamine-6-phosphate deacetylase
VIAAHRADVGIVTLASELEGGIDLVRALCAAGHRVSLGHSGADFDQAIEAFDAGAGTRPSLQPHAGAGAPRTGSAGRGAGPRGRRGGVDLRRPPRASAMCRLAMRRKGARGILAITDGTAGAGMAVGSTARLGSRSIRVGPYAAELENGTLAGSTLTMDRAFANIVNLFGGSLVDAALMCATNPAGALGLAGHGVIAEGAVADLTVLDRHLRVVRTFVGGAEVSWRSRGFVDGAETFVEGGLAPLQAVFSPRARGLTSGGVRARAPCRRRGVHAGIAPVPSRACHRARSVVRAGHVRFQPVGHAADAR